MKTTDEMEKIAQTIFGDRLENTAAYPRPIEATIRRVSTNQIAFLVKDCSMTDLERICAVCGTKDVSIEGDHNYLLQYTRTEITITWPKSETPA